MLARDWNIVLTGSPQEMPVTSSIYLALGAHKGLHNVCGKTSLTDLIFLIQNSNVVISHDSVVAHLAAILGKRVIALFGPTSPDQFSPRGQRVDIILGEGECRGCFPHPICDQTQCKVMKSINPQRVIDIFSESD